MILKNYVKNYQIIAKNIFINFLLLIFVKDLKTTTLWERAILQEVKQVEFMQY
jgi:hypothetical protein